MISDPDQLGVERERLIGGKGRSADAVWGDGDRRRDKYICVGCWEEDVLRGCGDSLQAGELLYVTRVPASTHVPLRKL